MEGMPPALLQLMVELAKKNQPKPWEDPSLDPGIQRFEPQLPGAPIPLGGNPVDPMDPMTQAAELEKQRKTWSEHPWIMKLRGLLGGEDPGRY